MAVSIVILAAGQGTRMHSAIPKVLHSLAGKTLLEHVVHTAQTLASTQPPIIVYGHHGDQLLSKLKHLNVQWIEQKAQLGTAHALQQAMPSIDPANSILVLYGDVPLISPNTLKRFIETTPKNALGIITATFANPQGLGRIIRDNDRVVQVVEEKDATPEQRDIHEINSGIYLLPGQYVSKWLSEISNHNLQQEFYLTDVFKLAVASNISIYDFQPDHAEEVCGVNNRNQLAQLERYYQHQQAIQFLHQGVMLMDPLRFDVRGDVCIGKDVVIDINVILEGRVIIGNNCQIGPNVILKNVILGDGTHVKANSILENSEIATDCVIGPFARIRPGTILASHSHIGNFVEIKNSQVGEASKVNHLTYIGDCDIGKNVNVGAGTITCNYDGANKHRTIIGDYAFIGSNSSLVAPIEIGNYATIGAGSTLTKNAPAHQLTLCRAPSRSIENWQRPKKKES